MRLKSRMNRDRHGLGSGLLDCWIVGLFTNFHFVRRKSTNPIIHKSIPFPSGFIRIFFLGALLLCWQNGRAQALPPDDFFHGGAMAYLSNNIPAALERVTNGLAIYPNDEKLKKLEELLKQQQQQNQQQQNQDQQQNQQKNDQSKQDQKNQKQDQQQSKDQNKSDQEKQKEQQKKEQEKKEQKDQQKADQQQAKKSEGQKEKPEEQPQAIAGQ